MNSILNIAGYKFTHLANIPSLRSHFLTLCGDLSLKGTILLSEEGININLAGKEDRIQIFCHDLKQNPSFEDIGFKHSFSATQPFQRLKVKLKKEIITMRQPEIDAVCMRAPSVSPLTLKQWLDEGRDIVLLDTRNDYEVRFGTFKGAINPLIDNFVEFPRIIDQLDKNKPVVMFCTGGIRCEKAGLYLLQQGFKEVYQLEGGILNYFAQAGGSHYEGDCYVFDERVALDPNLEASGIAQCAFCSGPVTKVEQSLPAFQSAKRCERCVANA